jgi:hypothetical protein
VLEVPVALGPLRVGKVIPPVLEQVCDPPPVLGTRDARAVVDLVRPDCLEIVNGPANVTRQVVPAGMVNEVPQCGRWVSITRRAREQDVAAAALRNAHKTHVDDCVGHEVAEPIELGTRGVEHAAVVIADRWNVLYAKNCRLEDRGSAGDSGIEGVAGIVTACVIVQVRVALARRACQPDLYVTNFEPRAVRAVDQRFDLSLLYNRT